MDKVTIQDDQVAPLDAIAPGLEGLRIVFVNVFGIRNADDSWTLIDAGIPGSTSRILHWAEERFASAPNAIVLTHGHFDHVGAADELSKEWGVPIYAHPLEFPYLTGEKEYPAPNVGAGGGLMSLLSPIYPRGPIDVSGRLKALPALAGNLSVAELPSWQLLQTPGNDAQIKDRLDALAKLEATTRADQAKAMDAIDELLDVRQRARFRLLEQQLELRKLELVNRARQRQRANRP